MNHKFPPRAALALTILAFLMGGTAGYAQPPFEVYTVNYPLAYFAERIGGADVKVTFPAPGDVDPALWNPDAATVRRYQNADLILLNGAGYARWVNRVSLPRKTTVDSARAFRDRYLPIEDSVAHSHGPSGAHSHTGMAFVTWLDLTQAIAQASAVKEAFVRARQASRAQFEANFTELERDLKALDADLAAAAAPLAKEPLLASHPVYQYMARRYALDLESVTWEPDEAPGLTEWQSFEKDIKNRPARWMLWEGAPRQETASRLKALGVGVIVFDPCPDVPETGDFLSVMRQNVANLKAAAGG